MARKTQPPPDTVRLFLVDDEPTVRRGLELLLQRQPGLQLCGAADASPETFHQILTLDPDLVILDVSSGSPGGLHLLRRLRRQCPRLRLLVFSMHGGLSFAQAAFRAGANGYVTKDEGSEKLLEAIALLAAGKSYLTEVIAARMPGWTKS